MAYLMRFSVVAAAVMYNICLEPVRRKLHPVCGHCGHRVVCGQLAICGTHYASPFALGCSTNSTAPDKTFFLVQTKVRCGLRLAMNACYARGHAALVQCSWRVTTMPKQQR